jgi:integrase
MWGADELEFLPSDWSWCIERMTTLPRTVRIWSRLKFWRTTATHLLAQGFSLKEIGDHLGHRLSKTTAVYAKVNLTGLREVANLSLRGLL